MALGTNFQGNLCLAEIFDVLDDTRWQDETGDRDGRCSKFCHNLTATMISTCSKTPTPCLLHFLNLRGLRSI